MYDADDPKNPRDLSFADFLESVPPGGKREVSVLLKKHRILPTGAGVEWALRCPEIRLHCATSECGGMRRFRGFSTSGKITKGAKTDAFLEYTCRNCGESSKTYAIRVDWTKDHRGHSVPTVAKFGEIPPFGAPLAPRLRRFTGDDHELFLKGWRAECQGLGIGSFSYYRRVVERQKDRILEDIHKAAERLGAGQELLSSLETAREERRFTKAIDLVKGALPDGLKIDGHNPLKLLHRALSKGLHELNDRECLEQAHAIRLILSELTSNISRVTAEKKELRAAVSTLLSSD